MKTCKAGQLAFLHFSNATLNFLRYEKIKTASPRSGVVFNVSLGKNQDTISVIRKPKKEILFQGNIFLYCHKTLDDFLRKIPFLLLPSLKVSLLLFFIKC